MLGSTKEEERDGERGEMERCSGEAKETVEENKMRDRFSRTMPMLSGAAARTS